MSRPFFNGYTYWSMWRWPLTIVSMAALMASVAAQDHPKISLVFPPGIASETILIDYHLTGPFGGYGVLLRPDKQRASYDIDPFVDGQPAENIKIIAYLPGCEIATFDLAFSGIRVERRLDCAPLGSVSLRGQVLPGSMTQELNREIEVNYLAEWSARFFGVFDGPVTTIRLGAVRPDRYGEFEITLPDLYKQSILRDGELQFILRDPKAKNIIAFLRPAGATPNSPAWLSVQAYYPFVQLIAEGNQQPTNGNR